MAQMKNVKMSKVPVSSLPKGVGAASSKKGATSVTKAMGNKKVKSC